MVFDKTKGNVFGWSELHKQISVKVLLKVTDKIDKNGHPIQ